MKPSVLLIICLIASLCATSANAMTYYLVRDLGVKDNMKRCLYSNDEIYAYPAISLCPMSIEVNGVQNRNTSVVGFLKGEYQDGMTKVCVYEVLGEKRAIRLQSYELCPQTYKF